MQHQINSFFEEIDLVSIANQSIDPQFDFSSALVEMEKQYLDLVASAIHTHTSPSEMVKTWTPSGEKSTVSISESSLNVYVTPSCPRLHTVISRQYETVSARQPSDENTAYLIFLEAFSSRR
jgi:hypothetical protein